MSIVTVSGPGEILRIQHDHGDPCAPDSIRRLEAAIDELGRHPRIVPDVIWSR